MNKVIGITAIAILVATPAVAADMAVKAPMLPAPVASWTGCYLGGNLGGAWQHNHTYDPEALFDTGGDSGSGFIGGGQIGCDYQFSNNWVIGIQDMFDGTDISSSHIYPGDAPETLGTDTKWVDTLTGRLGYAVTPQTLLYVKGGGAWARVNYSDIYPGAYDGQADVTRSGWTIGGGLEYAFLTNWSAFAEYNYIDLGNQNVALAYTCTGACGFPNPYTYTVSHNISEFLVGVNYRFGLLDGAR
jgi:outer membrane immunogenic protein